MKTPPTLLTLAGAAALLLAGCDSPAPLHRTAPSASATVGSTASPSQPAAPTPVTWPQLPADPVALEALIEQQTRRRVGLLLDLDVARLLAAVRDGVERDAVAAGWPAIAQRLSAAIDEFVVRGHTTYVLFGSFDDAPQQVMAFRRLTGPLGIEPPPLIAVEQLRSDGHWRGVDGPQLGDDALLRRYLARGERSTLAALATRQREHNYTAVKYAYVEQVLDLLSAARAARHRLTGCDMPPALQMQARKQLGDNSDKLRDLHCALTLERRLASMAKPHRVALFIGDAHLSPKRLPRFLSHRHKLIRVHLFGGRASLVGFEQRLRQRLRVTAPLLVPIAAARYALLLPGNFLGAAVNRIRSREAIAEAERHQLVLDGFEGKGQVGDKHLSLTQRTAIRAPAGNHSFLLPRGESLLCGTVDVPPDGAASLTLERDGTLTVHSRGHHAAPAP